MRSIEEFGRTVDEARNKALKALGVRSADEPGVEVEVLDPGSPGNDVGWGRKFARVKVTLSRAAAPKGDEREARDERPKRDKREDRDARDDRPKRKEPEKRSDRDDDEAPEILLEEILDLMHLQASVEEGIYDGQRVLNIVGPDLGILIGKHGQTLEALQFILNMIVNHNKEERTRIVVDVGGYRERRERTLRDLAHRMARRAYDEQCNIALEPMLANERRIIHLTLADDNRVETYSQGEEPMRKVIIAPRK
jgi:spoIIIJ-associated protein